MTARLLALSSSALLATIIGVACTATGNDTGGNDAPDGGGPDGGLDSSGDLGPDGGLDSSGDLGPDDGGDSGDGGGCGSVIEATIRDFKGIGEAGGHPDFEFSARGINNEDGGVFKGWNDSGCELVNTTLVGGLPEFNATPVTINGTPVTGIGARRRVVGSPSTGCFPATSGDCGIGSCTPWTDFKPPSYTIKDAASFNDWYHDNPTYNIRLTREIPLTDDGTGTNTKVFDSANFFPIDNDGWGNTPGVVGTDGLPHNFHFTTEIHVTFEYTAGQVFTFRGDDDLWIFVNNKLALDVGGSHQALIGTIDFDAQAAALGITPGNTYQMDIFHAERQSDASNFRIQTNIQCITNVPPVN